MKNTKRNMMIGLQQRTITEMADIIMRWKNGKKTEVNGLDLFKTAGRIASLFFILFFLKKVLTNDFV